MSVDKSWAAEPFEQNRKHLRSVAYRMLGSLSEADDAVQEAWLRLSRTDASNIEDLGRWLTTVVARISLDMLRARRSRAEEPVGEYIPDPMVGGAEGLGVEQDDPILEPGTDGRKYGDPEHEAMMADSISLALLIVLETLAPAERLVFVLHDMFDVPFDAIASIVGKTPVATRRMASRARRRIQGASTPPDANIGAQREVVAAYLAAARGGNFDALLRMLDPDVVVRSDIGMTSGVIRGADSVAKAALVGARLTAAAQFVIVNGAPGVIAFDEKGEPRSIVAFTVRKGRITQITVFADPGRLRQLDIVNVSQERVRSLD